MDSNAPGVHPQHALAVYAESLAAGARVALFGDASLGLGTKLVELGAHAVDFWDPDARRVRAEAERAPQAVTLHAYSEHDGDMRPIDLVIVADLGLFDDPAAIVRRARRMVGEDGVAIIAARSAGAARESSSPGVRAFDYYDLFDLVAPEFDCVRMIAQLPFHGVALVELGDEDDAPSVNVDTQLGEGGRAPEAFVVVASQNGARLEPYTIVQLPAPAAHADRSVAADVERAEAAADERERELDRAVESAAAERAAADAARAADREALAQAHLRTELLASQLEDLRRRLSEGERAAEAVGALEEALRARSAHAGDLESSLAARGRELAELSTEVEEMRAAAEAGRIAAAQVEAVALRSDRAERRVAVLEQEFAKGGDTQSKELADLEGALRERAQSVRALEVELARRDQMVRDLVGTLEEREAPPEPPPQPPPEASPPEVAGLRDMEASRLVGEENARLRAQLDSLALDLARREGEAQATAWQVTELERRLAQVAESPGAGPSGQPGLATDRQLAQALDQVEALRSALAQEHAARGRAESGEELARAHAEIQRQAVLMEQLVRELDLRPSPAFEGGAVGAGDPGSDSSEDSR